MRECDILLTESSLWTERFSIVYVTGPESRALLFWVVRSPYLCKEMKILMTVTFSIPVLL